MAEIQSHQALLLLGSNIERKRNIPLALAQLAAHPSLRLCVASSTYESAAVGGKGEQPVFSNAAALIETELTPHTLRQTLREIEASMGRVRSEDKYAPRPIDLDIVLYGDFVGDVDGSHIPDPDLLRWAHVAVPCAEIAPEWLHPTTGQPLQQISAGVDRRSLHPILEALSLTHGSESSVRSHTFTQIGDTL